MDINKNFLIALAYTAIHEKELDLPAFRQKVLDNQNALDNHVRQQKPSKARIGNRADYPGL